MTLELYQEVALTPDLPEYQLRAGDIDPRAISGSCFNP